MPNCFQLIRKSDPQSGPVPLNTVDEELCKAFNVPVDPVEYAFGWFYRIGFPLAMGRTLEQIREKHAADDYVKVVDWFIANFTSDAFYSPR